MQGSPQSSESIWTIFDSVTTAAARFLKWSLKVAWTRVTSTATFAVVGGSIVGGLDTVQGLSSVVTESDKFVFFDETERLVRFEYDRTLIEPLGGMAMCLGDLILENTDGRFTPDKNSTIGTSILPNRPLQMYLGFLVAGREKTIPIFKGLTQQPKENKTNGTLAISSLDYVKYLNEFPLEKAIYIDKRTDEIIEDILTDMGFGTSQFVLDEGLNTIPFAWFEKGETAGDRIRRICEAEEGFFYQDEAGILRYENRRHFAVSPYSSVVWDINTDDIITYEMDDSTPIINRAIVKAKPRAVQATQEIWRDGVEEEIGRGETKDIWIQFENPVTAITTPAATTDYTAYDTTGGTGTELTSDISISVTLFTTTAKLTVTNNSSVTAFINFFRLRGTPALVTSEIEEVFEDSTSVSKYTRYQIEIENDFIGSSEFAYYLARALVRKYRVPKMRIVIEVQGIPQLQIRDKVRVKDIDTGNYRTFRVMRIQGKLDGGLFTQTLYLREILSDEADNWAIVGSTILGSDSEFVGF